MFQKPIGNLIIGCIALGCGIAVMEDYSGYGSLIRTLGGASLILVGIYYAINAVLSAGDD